jgi:hypothetical protein
MPGEVVVVGEPAIASRDGALVGVVVEVVIEVAAVYVGSCLKLLSCGM